MLTQVAHRLLGDLGAVPETSQGFVAVVAEQGADDSGLVVMVDMEHLVTRPAGGLSSADGALPVLGLQEVLEGGPVEAVELLPVVRPKVLAVGVSPLLVLGSESLRIRTSSSVGVLPSLDGADPSSSIGVDRDSVSAPSAPCGTGVLVDLAEAVIGEELPTTPPPSGSVALDGDDSATGASGGSPLFVQFAQPVVHSSRGVPTDVSNGLSLDPSALAVGVGGDAGLRPASAMTGSSLNGAVRRAFANDVHKEDGISC